MIYGSVYGFKQRNPSSQVTSQQLNDYLLNDASVYLDSVLGDRFPVPFSANNLTVNMLVYDLVEMKARAIRERKGEGTGIHDWVKTMIEALQNGNMIMVQASSITSATGSADTLFYPPWTRLQANPDLVAPWNQVYANRGSYPTVFDMDDWITQQVDPNLVAVQRNERGLGINSLGM